MEKYVEGIVLDALDYKDKSKIVHLYTPFGMDSVLAVHAAALTSGKTAFAQTFNEVEYLKSKAALPKLIEYRLQTSHYDFSSDLRLFPVLSVFLQVLKNLDPASPHHRIYPFFKSCLAALEEKRNPFFVLAVFLVKMLAVFGVKPELRQCVVCKEEPIVSFSVLLGGALCPVHRIKEDTDSNTLSFFQKLYYFHAFEEDSFAVPQEFFSVIYRYYQEHVHLKLKDYRQPLVK